MPLLRRLDAIVARCHRLIERARDPIVPSATTCAAPARNGTPGIALTSQALPSKTRPIAHPARSAPDPENPYSFALSLRSSSSPGTHGLNLSTRLPCFGQTSLAVWQLGQGFLGRGFSTPQSMLAAMRVTLD